MEATQQRVQHVVENGSKADDTQRVEVADDIVRHTVRRQHGRQKTCSITQPVVIDILDGEKAKNPRRLECAADILHKLVIPMGPDIPAICCNY